jgi:hypothetical protein
MPGKASRSERNYPSRPDGLSSPPCWGRFSADLSTSVIGSGSASCPIQPMGRFAESPGPRFDGAMKIIQHADCFEVRSEDGSIVRKFAFDDDARWRAISRRMTRKQAFQAARTFAGKSYTVETAKAVTPIDQKP